MVFKPTAPTVWYFPKIEIKLGSPKKNRGKCLF
nr:MAG TPA: hypothetical protein [Caudoviricetes sp.]